MIRVAPHVPEVSRLASMYTPTMHSKLLSRHIATDDLARNPVQVLRAIGKGETIVVEQHGEPQAAIVDPLDWEILLAVIRYFVDRPRIDPEIGLDDPQLAELDAHARIEMAVAHYLAEAISLSRTAELLGKPWGELRERFSRLGIPIRTAPADEESARQDVLVAMSTLS